MTALIPAGHVAAGDPNLGTLVVFDPDGAIYCDSNTGPMGMQIASDLLAAQGYAGWSADELRQAWDAFSSNEIWNFFDGPHIAIAFHAVTVLFAVVRLGQMAWEQVK